MATASAWMEEFLIERGWEKTSGRTWDGSGCTPLCWTDMAPVPGRREVTHTVDVPDEKHRGKMLKRDVELFVSGGGRGCSYSFADAFALEMRRNREPLPLFEPYLDGNDWLIRDRQRNVRRAIVPFLSLAEAEAFCEIANQPGSCNFCGERPGKRDVGPVASYPIQLPRLGPEGLYRVATRIWENDYLLERAHLETLQKVTLPAPPADVVERTASSMAWLVRGETKVSQDGTRTQGEATDVRTGTRTVTVCRCPECGVWPSRFGPPPKSAPVPQAGHVG
jgi:hypothetical protein